MSASLLRAPISSLVQEPAGRATRPVLRWHGGKWRLAKWVIQHLPEHRIYCEPYGGAASVLLRKRRAYAEIYNDLDGDLVNLFQVLRSTDAAARLIRELELTPFARDEFEGAYLSSDDPVEEARRLIVRSFMGFGSDGCRKDLTTGFRASSHRSGTTPAGDWANYPEALGRVITRLRGVVVENRDAVACMAQHDSNETLFYLDPPYLPETRQMTHRRHGYAHEMSEADHRRLLGEIPNFRGMIVLSGYPSPAYDHALPGWRRVERAAHADGARPRREVLWVNQAAHQRLEQQLPFGHDAGEA